MKRLSMQLENVSKMTTSLTSTLMLIASGRMSRVDVPLLSRKIEEVNHLSEILPILSKWIECSLKELSVKTSLGKDLVTVDEIDTMTKLKKAIDTLLLCFIDLYPVAKIIIQNNNTKTSQNRTNNSVLNGGNANLSSLVILAGKCLQVKIFISYLLVTVLLKLH